MKALILICLIFITTNSFARDIVVALSPHQSPENAKAQVISVLKFATALDGGDRVFILDGAKLQTIGMFSIPENKAYANPKARMQANGKAVKALFAFACNTSGDSSAVNLPLLLHHIAERFMPTAPLDVLVLGSPFYNEVKEPAFSMTDGLVPSDAHIASPRSETPFGSQGHKTTLQHIRLHMLFDAENIFHSTLHRDVVKRFWSLYLHAQGGALSTFTADQDTALSRLRSSVTPPKLNTVLDPASKLEMIRLRTQTQELSIYDRPVSTAELPTHLITAARNVQIDISWDCGGCDLDLHVAPASGAPILSFANTQSEHGIHIKDFTSSPQSMNGYETVEFTRSVDLRRVGIVVNVYRGDASKNITGEIRISAEGKTFAKAFALAATAGNQGADIITVLRSGQSSAHSLFFQPLMITNPKRS